MRLVVTKDRPVTDLVVPERLGWRYWLLDLESQEVVNSLQGFWTAGRYVNPRAKVGLFEPVLDISL